MHLSEWQVKVITTLLNVIRSDKLKPSFFLSTLRQWNCREGRFSAMLRRAIVRGSGKKHCFNYHFFISLCHCEAALPPWQSRGSGKSLMIKEVRFRGIPSLRSEWQIINPPLLKLQSNANASAGFPRDTTCRSEWQVVNQVTIRRSKWQVINYNLRNWKLACKGLQFRILHT